MATKGETRPSLAAADGSQEVKPNGEGPSVGHSGLPWGSGQVKSGTPAPLDLDRLIAEITSTIDGRRLGNGEIRFRCPSPDHDDRDPSADWNPTKGTWLCRSCGAEGGAKDLAELLGMDLDRFREGEGPKRRPRLPSDKRLQEARAILLSTLPEAEVAREYLTKVGLDPITLGWGLDCLSGEDAYPTFGLGRKAAGWRLLVPVYHPVTRDLVECRRYAGPFPMPEGSEKAYPWAAGHGAAKPYGWNRVPRDDDGHPLPVPLVWCEGEKDAEVLTAHGILAVSHTNGAGSGGKVAWDKDLLPDSYLQGRQITILFDHDKAGEAGALSLNTALTARGAEVQIARWPDIFNGEAIPQGFDAADWFGRGWSAEDLQGAVLNAAIAHVPTEDETTAPESLWFGPGHLGIARKFHAREKDQLLPVAGRVWYRYQDGIWLQLDDDDPVRGLLWDLCEETLEGTDKTVNKSMVNSVLDAVVTLPDWRKEQDDLDAHPFLVNVRNGVVDLDDGDLKDHRPGLLQTVQRPFEYDPNAECPRWRKFLRETLVTPDGQPDPQLAALVQEWFGYCLIPQTAAQKAMIWIGEGSNGKGVATEMLEALVGKANVVGVQFNDLGDAYTRATLKGKLVALITEVPSRALVEDATFKSVVSGDSLSARLPYGHPFTFKPFSRFLITCNELPSTRDTTWAFYRRLLIVPWLATFEENPTGQQRKRDSDLRETLAEELPGIFAWAIEGLWRLRNNRWRFTPSDAASRELERYRLDADSVALWAAEVAILDHEAETPAADLYDSYKRFCEDYGYKPVGYTSFGRRLSSALGDAVENVRTKRERLWRGIRVPVAWR